MTSFPLADWTNQRMIEACLSGNQNAWAALIHRYRKLIFSIPLKFGASTEDAADIFQSVCLELFSELPRLRDADALAGWLVRVTTNRCYQWKRAQAPAAEELEEIPEASAPAPALMEEIEREQIIREAMEELPARCRKMVEMLFFEQPPVPYSEVARRLGLAAGSIGFIRGRCLTKLKSLLEEKGF